ncbi:hypothetical protein NE237_006786 [Protea cynaroides]|uniref:Uncharacterized protein n=1 Tax=Protea cynaroides TaxID=273540 RepID=A0A9Q0KN14_9MAGN|nr:hypothetical protein NE237_006786 [Protea cynaroides]
MGSSSSLYGVPMRGERKKEKKLLKSGINHQQKLPETEESNFLAMTSLCFLTFNAVFTSVRAHAHHDISTMFFIFFLYFGFLSLLLCFKAIERFPPHEESPKKEVLKFAIWVLSTSLNVGLALKFAPLIHPIGGVFLCVLATVTSGISFYFCFIYRPDPSGHCCRKKQFLVSSPFLKVDQKDTKPFEPISPSENV